MGRGWGEDKGKCAQRGSAHSDLLSDAFFQNLTVKKRKAPVSVTDIMISPVRLGAMSGASEVRMRTVSLNAPNDRNVKTMAKVLHLFIGEQNSIFAGYYPPLSNKGILFQGQVK
jgi:hypothetical protein